MAFQFPLESLLRVRRMLEDREQLHLQTLLSRRAQMLSQLEQLQSLGCEVRQRINASMTQAPSFAVAIGFGVVQQRNLAQVRARLQAELTQLEITVAEQAERLREKRREREVVESLRQNQLRDYLQVERRREQARLDELHLLRRLHKTSA